MRTLDRLLITRANEQMENEDIKFERAGQGIIKDTAYPYNNPGRCRICNAPIIQARLGRSRIICKLQECQRERKRIHQRA
jgi:hypothetical protein